VKARTVAGPNHQKQKLQYKTEAIKERNAVTEIEELQKIQREATERRAERAKGHLADEEAKVSQSAGAQPDSPLTDAPPGGNVSAAIERASPGLGDQLGSLLEELEDAARDHPALALLATFSLGVIVGQLFSRK
jgi:hypothetical protein